MPAVRQKNATSPIDVFFVVLSTHRLFVINTRKGAFGILYENEGVVVSERSSLTAHFDHGNVFFVTTADGVQRGYLVTSARGLSNQDPFLMNAGRLLARSS